MIMDVNLFDGTGLPVGHGAGHPGHAGRASVHHRVRPASSHARCRAADQAVPGSRLASVRPLIHPFEVGSEYFPNLLLVRKPLMSISVVRHSTLLLVKCSLC